MKAAEAKRRVQLAKNALKVILAADPSVGITRLAMFPMLVKLEQWQVRFIQRLEDSELIERLSVEKVGTPIQYIGFPDEIKVYLKDPVKLSGLLWPGSALEGNSPTSGDLPVGPPPSAPSPLHTEALARDIAETAARVAAGHTTDFPAWDRGLREAVDKGTATPTTTPPLSAEPGPNLENMDPLELCMKLLAANLEETRRMRHAMAALEARLVEANKTSQTAVEQGAQFIAWMGVNT